MRFLMLIAALLFAAPALAETWRGYANDRFGYEILIPPDLDMVAQSDNGDGATFKSSDGRQVLAVWGGNIIEGDFDYEVTTRLIALDEKSWNITYKAVTPTWASFSGSKGGQVIYWRAISLCGGTQYAMFQFDYPLSRLHALNDTVDRLVSTLAADGRC